MSDQKQTSIRSIVVFCGSNFGVSPVYADAARALGTEMGRRGLKLIYGGTNKGLMGVLAESAMEADAKVEGGDYSPTFRTRPFGVRNIRARGRE
jgi:predicted Rossmann-fold nucleotide-binding protein